MPFESDTDDSVYGMYPDDNWDEHDQEYEPRLEDVITMRNDDWDWEPDIPDGYCDQNGHSWEPNGNGGHVCVECGYTKGPQPYLMGTPEETFLKNVWHFGLLKALHRYFESKCVKYVTEEWILHKNMKYNPHNFVFYRAPWWKFWVCSHAESILRKKVYPKKK